MAGLGRSLAFYLKYATAVDNLLFDECDLEALPNAEDVLDMAGLIRERALDQLRRFYLELHQVVLPLLDNIALVGDVARMVQSPKPFSKPERRWYSLGSKTAPKLPKALLGFSLEPEYFWWWLWTVGGRAAEEAVARLLGPRVQGRSREWGGDAGTLSLGSVEVFHQGQGREPERDRLINKAREWVAPLSEDLIDHVLSTAAAASRVRRDL